METVVEVEGVKGVRGVGVLVAVVLVVAVAARLGEGAGGSKGDLDGASLEMEMGIEIELAGWFEDLEETEAGSLLADLEDL